MITDKPPRKAIFKQEYGRSDAITSVALPPAAPLRRFSRQLEEAMKAEDRREIEVVCNEIAAYISDSWDIACPKVRVLGVRPLEEVGDMVDEMYGDYDFETAVIRLWMRTAVLEKMTSFGTLLSTLCHELCHHLDVVNLELPNTYHTRGFYERSGALYHHARGTPVRALVWDKLTDGTYRINWPLTMKSGKSKASAPVS